MKRYFVFAAILLTHGLVRAADARLAADSFVSASQANQNNGNSAFLSIGGNANRRALIRFDLATLPAGTTGATVAKANLIVYGNNVAAGSTFNVVRVGAAWAEATLTNASMPALGATEVTAVSGGTNQTFISIDITNLVKDWLNGTLVNNGVALVANASGTTHPWASGDF